MSSVFFNPGFDSYQPPSPSDPRVLGFIPESTQFDQFGLAHRFDVTRTNGIVKEIKGFMPDDVGSIDFNLYQSWVDAGWKTVHGSSDSVTRFNEKLEEELQEVEEALELHEEIGSVESRTGLLKEIGDVMWCMGALASNAYVQLDHAVKLQMYKYVVGTRWVDRGQTIPPQWRPEAIATATAFDALSIGAIDGLMRRGFEPTSSAARYIYDHPDFEEPQDVLLAIRAHVGTLKSLSFQQYGYGEEPLGEIDLITDSGFKEYSDRMAPCVATTQLQLAYLAHCAGGTFAEVIKLNIEKLNGRMEQGLIDKEDGLRGEG